MALIKCEECGKEISNKAKACIHCGCPITCDESVDIVKKESANEYYDQKSRKLMVAFHAVVSNKSKESTLNNIYIKQLDRNVELLVPNNIKKDEQIWKKLDASGEIVIFTVQSVSVDPSIQSIVVDTKSKKKEDKTLKEIIYAYKPTGLARFFDGPGVSRIMVLFITFALIREMWIMEVLLTIAAIECLLILMKMCYPFHHVKQYIRKNHIDDAIKHDPNYRDVAALAYALMPGKKMLRYIKKLNTEAGLEVERQINRK